MSEQEVLAHFHEHSGKRYDPEVVAALSGVVGQRKGRGAVGAREESLTERRGAKARAGVAN
ncbi:MAG: hypothetical protein GTN78_14660 [Gemmatimonadales bacterium]|nr:hypothetical protein [Gemmatimonadales bacterium]